MTSFSTQGYGKLHFLFLFFTKILLATSYGTLKSCKFDQIYQFGDSRSDVGNLIRELPHGPTFPINKLPFGQTFFKNATGRVSDGLLLIDYIVREAGLPLLNPHLNFEANFTHGEDFAVAGATVLSGEILAEQNITSFLTNSSLGVQLDWMLEHLNSTCYPNKDCAKKLKNSLFMVGEIGGNDYNYALSQGKTLKDIMNNEMPILIQVITDTIRTLIKNGAIRIVVPGQFPFGCFPIHLTLFKSSDPRDYDEFHCLKSVNDMFMEHNIKLQHALQELKQEFPNAIIIYGDYYNVFLWLLRNAPYFGFHSTTLQKSCCGEGGEYNYDPRPEMSCGFPRIPVCADPRHYISWDGIHMTQEAHKMIAMRITRDIFPKLQCTSKLTRASLGRKALKPKYL